MTANRSVRPATSAPVRTAAPVPVWPEPAPAGASLEPKPLPPLRQSGGTPLAYDAPVVEPAPQPTRVVIEPPAAPRQALEPAPVEREVAAAPATTAAPEPAPTRTPPPPRSSPQTLATNVDDTLTPPSLSGVGFLWPIPSLADGLVVADTSGEGGLMIDAPGGEPFVAAENGVVVFAAEAIDDIGRLVVVRHDGDYTTSYAQAGAVDVVVGDIVRRGQRLGLVAPDDGRLYFEMRVANRVVDPRAYLVGAPQLASR